MKIGGRPTTVEEMYALEDWYILIDSAMIMCKVEPVFEEQLDDDEPTMLTDAVDDEDEDDKDDATTEAILVDDTEDVDDQDFNPDDDGFA
ncbi:hypothetical protein HAX54_014522 [Datura stramonium]|uniref:Uncharacterized protein n=1 Tax=Datura stramonium TaxID=4076 RepID=A0ABS8TPR6_DATST|nr:hypothetical protein [Datura stramonium]